MNRRELLKRALQLSAAGLIVPPFLRRGTLLGLGDSLANASVARTLAGRILVVVHYNGGNDGLNTVVPVDDPVYYQQRPTLAIPPEEAVLLEPGTGLHPGLAPLADLYNSGRMAVIQGIGYPDMSLSHFRGTDIWLSAQPNDVLSTGWLARYLEAMFPTFPDLIPESPFALQQAFAHRIPLTGERGITGVVVDNPDTFYTLVNETYTGPWNDELPDTRGGEELGYVRQIDVETFEYAQAIQDAAAAGTNSVVYPETNLGFQLQIVGKLISGQLDTPIYLTAEFGFDTHAGQASPHAGLMGSVGQSVAAFMDDLANQGLDEKVLLVTTSEFGRRVHENGSYGTDHGTAAPHFAIGQGVQGGIYGTNPDLQNLDGNNNLLIQHDYRAFYASILRNHFGASVDMANDVLLDYFAPIGFLTAPTGAEEVDTLPGVDRLHPSRPNPVSIARFGQIRVRFDLARAGRVGLELFDVRGRRVAGLLDSERPAGRHAVSLNLRDLSAGLYLLRLTTPRGEEKAKLSVLP